jgi:protein-S-isoprenylcysteine O-methyltransferase Ste14
MQDTLSVAISTLWIAWLAYWFISARNVKATQWRAPLGTHALYRVPTLVTGVLLIGSPEWLPAVLQHRFLPASDGVMLLAVITVAAGLGFAVWARRHLGRNWSSTVTLKENHALIRTGPYRSVRHPIYTGILLALVGTMIAIGRWRAVLAVAFALVGFFFKIRIEEGRMRATFPEYEEYRKHTAALVPFVL